MCWQLATACLTCTKCAACCVPSMQSDRSSSARTGGVRPAVRSSPDTLRRPDANRAMAPPYLTHRQAQAVVVPAGEAVTVPAGEAVAVPAGEAVAVPSGEAVAVPSGEAVAVPAGEAVAVPAGEAVAAARSVGVALAVVAAADKSEDRIG